MLKHGPQSSPLAVDDASTQMSAITVRICEQNFRMAMVFMRRLDFIALVFTTRPFNEGLFTVRRFAVVLFTA